MIKNNEVTLNDSVEETTIVAQVFMGFKEEVHSSIKMESHTNLFTSMLLLVQSLE